MKTIAQKALFYPLTFAASVMMCLTTGCVSGGFKLTRQYAGWVNSQHIVIKSLLYILGFVIFAITLIPELTLWLPRLAGLVK